MKKLISSKPLIGPGWLRAILYMMALAVVAGISLLVFFIGIKKTTPNISAILELKNGEGRNFLTGIVFLLVIGLTYFFRRWIDRKSFISLGLSIKGFGKQAIAGGSMAVFIICAGSLLLKTTGHLKWMDIIFDPRALFLSLGSIFLLAFSEELIFRGYLLRNLMDTFPKWLALGISSLLFMVFYWNSNGLFPLVNAGIMGLIMGMNYVHTRNLWFSVCFHTAWKFMEGPVLGFYGNESFQTLLQTDLLGDTNITGGKSGLEGSALLTAFSLLGAIALYLFQQKKLTSRSQPVPGRR